MKKLILYILICFSFSNLMGQRLEISGGLNRNHFYDCQENNPHFITKYNYDYGYSIGISIEDIKQDTLPFRITLKFDNYNGKISTTNGGLGGSSTTEAEVNKNIIGLGIYPLNFKAIKNFRLSLGVEFNFLINERTTGHKSSWLMGAGSKDISLEDGSIEINNKFNYEILSRIGYDINVMKDWYIVLQYLFYLGLANEFKNIEARTKSLRHYMEIGIIKRFK